MLSIAFTVIIGQADLGTVAAPYQHTGSFTFDGDTRTRGASVFDSYACAPSKPERGPEYVFRVEVLEPSDIDVLVEDATDVDIDVHLLSSLSRAGTSASDCIMRADIDTTAFHVAAGTYYVVADTYGTSAAKAGPFRLFVRVYPTASVTWQTIGRGVRWGRGSHDESAGFSVLNVIAIDPSQGAHLQLLDTGHCNTLGSMTLPANVVAATNAGYFEGGCSPDGLLRVNGTTLAVSEHGRYSVALQSDGETVYSRPALGADWTVAPFASEGAGYFDWRSGTLEIGDDLSFGRVRHPRTVVGSSSTNQFLFTLDGRGHGGLGATFSILGAVLQRVGAEQGLNFDGGSSTTMWVRGEPSKGVVSFPAEHDPIEHAGVHAVGSLAVIVAEPVARVVFVTLPDLRELDEGASFVYAPAAALLSGSGTPTITATTLPLHAHFDGATLTYEPEAGDRGAHELVLQACVGPDCVEQRFTLSADVPDAPEPSGPSGATTGATSGGSTEGGTTSSDSGGTTGGLDSGGSTGSTTVTPQQQPATAPAHSGCSAAPSAGALRAMCALALLWLLRARVR